MKTTVTVGLTEDLIKELATFIDDNFIKEGQDLSKLAIVFGGARPRLFLQKELSLRVKRPFFPPKFFAIDDLIETLLLKDGPFSKISDLEACHTIYRLAKKEVVEVLRGRESFAQFLPWAREILAFIEQLDLEAVAVKSLKDVQNNAAIGYDVPDSINSLLEHIIVLRDAFHAILDKNRSYTRGYAYLLASRLVEEQDLDEFDRVLFCGFFYLHKTEEAVLKKFYERGKAVMFFQGDEREWSVLAKTAGALGCSIQPQNEARPCYELSVHSGSDLHAQVCHAREVLKTIKDQDRTVVVLPDPETIIPFLSETAALMGDFNISMGYPVSRSSLYSLFECLFKAQETKKGKAYYARDYLRLLGHPLVKNLDLSGGAAVTRVLVHKLEEVLLGIEKTPLAGALFVTGDDILKEEALYEAAEDTMKRMDVEARASDLKAINRRLHELLFQDWEDIANFRDFSSCLEGFLDVLLHKSLLDKYPLNLKVITQMYAIVDEFNDASFADEAFPKEDIFKVFKNKLDNEMVSFSGSPLKGLQVLGLFETRTLSFDNVIVLDANESVLPKLKIYEPLIPRDVSLSLGLNRLEKEEEIQRYQFLRLLSSARRVHLFYQETADKEKSRFIEELIWKKEKASGEIGCQDIVSGRFIVKVTPKEIAIAKRPCHVAFLESYRYSASSVNTYLHCPLRFYYQHVLGLKEKESLLDEPEASDIGTFIHNVLEEAFKKFVGLRPRVDDEFKDHFRKILDEKFEHEFARKMKSDAFLIKEVVDLRMAQFLDHERERDVKTLVCVEKAYEDKIDLGKRGLSFKAKIDRIDRLSDDSLLIIDYKTGSSDIMPASPEKIEAQGFGREALKITVKSFQLPIYYHLVGLAEKDVKINAVLYNIRNPGKDFGANRFFRNEEGPAQKERALGIFMKALECLCSEILDPRVPFKADEEDSRYCQNCPFFYLCR